MRCISKLSKGESILSGLVSAVEVKATPQEVYKTVREITQKPLQVGGNATVGRGLCQMHIIEEVE